jgi:hypothetical protein
MLPFTLGVLVVHPDYCAQHSEHQKYKESNSILRADLGVGFDPFILFPTTKESVKAIYILFNNFTQHHLNDIMNMFSQSMHNIGMFACMLTDRSCITEALIPKKVPVWMAFKLLDYQLIRLGKGIIMKHITKGEVLVYGSVTKTNVDAAEGALFSGCQGPPSLYSSAHDLL